MKTMANTSLTLVDSVRTSDKIVIRNDLGTIQEQEMVRHGKCITVFEQSNLLTSCLHVHH